MKTSMQVPLGMWTALAVTLLLPNSTARAESSAPVHLTFAKAFAGGGPDPYVFHFTGSFGGDYTGTLYTGVLDAHPADAENLFLEAVYTFTAADGIHSFTAHVAGLAHGITAKAVLNGVVETGAFVGAKVQVKFDDLGDGTYVGTVDIAFVPVHLTFAKAFAGGGPDPFVFHFTGSFGGDHAGSLYTGVLDAHPADELNLFLDAVYTFSADDGIHSFTARVAGLANGPTAKAVLNGVVTAGVFQGAQVQVKFDDLGDGSYLGTVGLLPGSTAITRGGFVLNRRAGRVVQQVSVTNRYDVPLAGPVYLVLDALSPATSLANRTGTTAGAPSGSPYIVIAPSSLAPGATVRVTLEFTSPPSGGIAYTARTIAGVPTP